MVDIKLEVGQQWETSRGHRRIILEDHLRIDDGDNVMMVAPEEFQQWIETTGAKLTVEGYATIQKKKEKCVDDYGNLYVLVSEAEQRALRSSFSVGLNYAVALITHSPFRVELIATYYSGSSMELFAKSIENKTMFKAKSETVWELITS